MIRTLIWFVFFWAYLVVLIPKMKRAQKYKAAGDEAAADAIVNRYVHRWAAALLRLAGVTVTVKGLENIPQDTPVVFVANHQGNFDIPLLLVYLDKPHALVAKIETLKIPLVRSWMKLLDCVFLDRKNPRQSVAALNEAGETVKRGKSVIIFPEGTRSRGDAMGEFKHGAFKIAFKTKSPLVPIVIDGSYRVMEANHNLMRPAHVHLTILPAVATQGLDKEALKLLPQQLAKQIAAHKAKA